jgi:branched-chain amino acid transport system ATP-binding protein
MALLELDRVTASYGAVDALNAVSLRVEEGEIVTLLGANGAGKTTTLRTISGLMKPRSGSIRFLGKEIAGASANSIVRLGLSHVPEGRRIFPGLTVRENILLGSSNRSRVPKAELDRDIEAAFGIFPDILKFADAPGWTLSGGQQQMVAVARGLMARPKLLMLDEPSLGLAPIIVQQVFRTIAAIRERGTTVLLVEQNAHMALSIADRGYVLETGRLIVEGPPATLLNNEEVRAAYLGGRVTAG